MKGRATCRRFEGARIRIHHHRRISRKRSCALLAVAATAAVAPVASRAAVDNWQVGSGNWSTAGNWTTGLPASGNDVAITENDAINRVVTYDYTGTNSFSSLTLDQIGTGTNTLSQSAHLLAVAGNEYVGLDGNGVVNQSGGTHTIGGNLSLGGGNVTHESFGSGTYNLSASASLTVAGSEFLGYKSTDPHNQSPGSGVFNQSGGTHTFTSTLTIGNGAYYLSGGLVQSIQDVAKNGGVNLYPVNIGYGGFSGGTLYVSGGRFDTGFGGIELTDSLYGSNIYLSGGTITTAGVAVYDWGALVITGGTLNLTGGAVGSSNNPGTLTVGSKSGSSTLNEYFVAGPGPTPTVTTVGVDFLVVGGFAGASATYNLSNSASLQVTNFEEVGFNGGTGVFNQTGGTQTIGIGGALWIGRFAGTGTVNLSGGLLTAPGAQLVQLGTLGGVGILNVSGGGTLSVGTNAITVFNTSSGTNISGINLSGGTTSAGFLVLPDWSRLNFSGGTLNLGAGGGVSSNTGTLVVGNAGTIRTATLNLADGSVFADNASIGLNSGSGTVNQSDGSFTVAVQETIGSGGSGVFTQTGGTNNAQLVDVGNGGPGTYNLQAGTLNVNAGAIDIAINGARGTYNQSGGVANAIQVRVGAFGTGGIGIVNLSGGSLGVQDVLLGGFGTSAVAVGILNSTGGALTASDGITIYNSAIGTNVSSMTINGGGTVSAGFITTPDWARLNFVRGTLNLTGGVSSNTGTLSVGKGTTTTVATLNLPAGSVFADSASIGLNSGSGTINQSGGTFTLSQTLSLGLGGGKGIYNLSGGALTVTGQENIGFGAGGSGVFTQSGGTHNALSAVDVGNGEPGTYNLQAGTFNASAIDIAINGASASYNQSGGAANASQVRVGAFGTGGIGIVNLSGGSLGVSGVLLGGIGTSAVAVGILNSTGGSLTASNGITIYNSAIGTNVSSMTINGGGTVSAGFITTPDWSRLHFVRGTLNLTGGVSSNAGTLSIGSGSVGGAVLNLSGGSLTAGSTVNNGTFNETGGTASLGALSGTGSAFVGNTAGTAAAALMTVTSFAQNAVTIRNTGTLRVATNAARVTNTATTLTITGSGLLDLGNHTLLVNNTATPESTVRQYLHNAYNADASGIGNWLGKGGITSSDAIAAHNGSNPSFKISVGYVNGAYANDPLIGGPIPGQPTLATNRIFVRPALYGDFNVDGKVDDTDLAIFSGLGQYNKPTDKFGWLGGDLNHDGKVDDTDLLIFSGAGNYNGPPYAAAGGASQASAIPNLTGGGGAAATSVGAAGDGVLDFVYDPATGDLKVSYDGDTRITAANPLQVIRFKSAGGHFIPANFNASGFSNVTTDDSTLNGTILGAGSLPDGYDLGHVLAAGLQAADLTTDLTLQWNVSGGGLSLKNGDVIAGVPEPAALALMGLAASSRLLTRQPQRRH